MGRLTNLKPRFTAAKPRLARKTDAHGHSPAREPWRDWYKTERWQKLRRATFERDHYRCQCGCGAVTGRPVADHIKDHRGDPVLFWDPDNIQTLTKPCHDKWKQAQEHQRRTQGG